jgi:hypothetical protein
MTSTWSIAVVSDLQDGNTAHSQIGIARGGASVPLVHLFEAVSPYPITPYLYRVLGIMRSSNWCKISQQLIKRHLVTDDKSQAATELSLTWNSLARPKICYLGLRCVPWRLQQDPLCELVTASFAKLRCPAHSDWLSPCADFRTRLTLFLTRQEGPGW